MINNTQYINLTLTVEQINHILAALQELPAKICNPLSLLIKQQAEAQLMPPTAAEAEAEAE